MKKILIAWTVFLLATLTSCHKVKEYTATTDSTKVNHITYIYDSIHTNHYHNTYVINDTVYIVDSVFSHTINKNMMIDTIYHTKCDTVFLTKVVSANSDGERSHYKFRYWALVIFIIIVLILLIISRLRIFNNN